MSDDEIARLQDDQYAGRATVRQSTRDINVAMCEDTHIRYGKSEAERETERRKLRVPVHVPRYGRRALRARRRDIA